MQIEFQSDLSVELVQAIGNDELIAHAAMVSTRGRRVVKGETEKTKGLIEYLVEHRHGTPFERNMLTFRVHAPIMVWREHHRHRIGFSYNEESGRYKQLDPVFYIPPPERPMIPVEEPTICSNTIVHSSTQVQLSKQDQGIKICPACKKEYRYHTSARPCLKPAEQWQYDRLIKALKRSYTIAYTEYEQSMANGIVKEVARLCLPVAIYSSCYVTCNCRSLMHFLSLRTHDDEASFVSYPQWEIERVAYKYEEIFREFFPITYNAWEKAGRVAP